MSLVQNPILLRELRSRMRGNRAVWLQLFYVVVLSAVVLIAFFTALGSERISEEASWLGRLLFRSIACAQGALLALTAPAFAAAAVSGEREQQTFDSLLVTPLRAGAIVRGKLVAATMFVLLLLTISLPLAALSFLFGGVSPDEIAGTFAVQFANGLFLAALGLGFSVVCRTTMAATVATYLCVTAYLMVTGMLVAGAMSQFPLAAMSPIGVPWFAAEEFALLGRPVAIWIPSALAVLLLAGWVVDSAAGRIAHERDGSIAMRPRIWLTIVLVVVFAAIGWTAAQAIARHGYGAADAAEMQAMLVLVAMYLCLALAIILCSDGSDAETGAPPGWQLWRHHAATATAYLTLLPWLLWPLLAWLARAGAMSADWTTGAVGGLATASLVVLVNGTFIRQLDLAAGSRWATVMVGGLALLAVHTTLYLATVWPEYLATTAFAGLAAISPMSLIGELVAPERMHPNLLLDAVEIAVGVLAVHLAALALTAYLGRRRHRAAA